MDETHLKVEQEQQDKYGYIEDTDLLGSRKFLKRIIVKKEAWI